MQLPRRVFLALALGAPVSASRAADRSILLATTTSAENSGLLGYLLPRFEKASGIRVKVVAVGTGQALKLGERGDADLLLLHHPPSEEAFVAAGFGIDRREIMANDFLLVGPAEDPAGARGRDVLAAFRAIAASGAPFVSRGDASGTHERERELWRAAGIDPGSAARGWYREAGSGMGATLNIAAAMGAYTLADRGTWASFANRRGLVVLVEGDPRLSNVYAVTLVNPARHPHVKVAEARALADWLGGPEGQAAIGSFEVGGTRPFRPIATARAVPGSDGGR
ncbi:MAG: tungsten ABC transporter substrate-binding protein [Geminicoccaceae bacterium]|jgi:tungstate transport system substrate-binding protein|nr:MAG: tungsten ABC transporter substrate-binding protein [Geminicoccaceae bacterium]